MQRRRLFERSRVRLMPRLPAPQWRAQALARPACGEPKPGRVHCLAFVESNARHDTSGYGWTRKTSKKPTICLRRQKAAARLVAIVDSYDNPDVASDLAVYRSHFGLGKAKFKKFNQEGQQKNYPPGNPGWGVEIDLDVEMVSAACPKCTIDLDRSGQLGRQRQRRRGSRGGQTRRTHRQQQLDLLRLLVHRLSELLRYARRHLYRGFGRRKLRRDRTTDGLHDGGCRRRHGAFLKRLGL